MALGMLQTVASAQMRKVTGVVVNGSTQRPAVGDRAVLYRVRDAQSATGDATLEEEGSGVTNSDGAFSLTPRAAGGVYMLRILHEGVVYEYGVTPGRALHANVFEMNGQPGRLAGSITGTIEIVRIAAEKGQLAVADMIELANESFPQRIETGDDMLAVTIPANATLRFVLAANPEAGAPPRVVPALPVPHRPNRYSVSYPLRPGLTHFSFNYTVPYDGQSSFRIGSSYPVRQFAVMYPAGMLFRGLSPQFERLRAGDGSYGVEAAERVPAGERPGFMLTGFASKRQPDGTAFSASPGIRTRLPVAPRVEKRWHGWSGVMLEKAAALLLFAGLVVCLVLIWLGTGRASFSRRPAPEALKDRLFDLELRRVRGLISGAEHATAKREIENAIQREHSR